MARQAISATICSASFLERPVPPSNTRLVVVGPGAVEHVARHAEIVVGGDLLQRRLPVEPRAELGGPRDEGVEDGVDDLGRPLDAELDVDGADDGLDGVGEDRRLAPPAGGLLAPAEPDVVAEGEHLRHLGERLGAHDRGAQLGQLALREVGVGAEQGVRHDQPEDRVAQELQALVVGHLPVLVRERAVRQRMLEEVGVQVGDAEHLTQRVDGQGPGQRT